MLKSYTIEEGLITYEVVIMVVEMLETEVERIKVVVEQQQQTYLSDLWKGRTLNS